VRLWDSETLYGVSLEDDLARGPWGGTARLARPWVQLWEGPGSFRSLGLEKGSPDRYTVGEGLGVGNWAKVYAASTAPRRRRGGAQQQPRSQ